MRAVILAGGTGGAKLAAGMQDILGDQLTVIVNTADDTEALGVHVSPDPDLVTYWLTNEIDAERGWGIKDDSFTVFDRLVKLGSPSWFGLSDRDLATCLRRTALLAAGGRQTEVQCGISQALGARARVVTMSDNPVRTRVRTAAGWFGLQEYLIREGAGEVADVEFSQIENAAPSAEALDAIDCADLIVVGPSNPVISIGPILGLPGMREAIGSAGAPVVAVSPYVGGEILKGPTNDFMRARGHETDVSGVIAAYDGLLDGIVVDSGDPGPPPHGIEAAVFPTLMDGPDSRRAVASQVLEFASSRAKARG
ncbi:MAG: 2-phospho-L-lactate transferase CofD family protein [Solirubrobacterales bacterium]